MFSKKRSLLLVSFFVLAANTGCNLPIYEDPPAPSEAPETALGTECLSGVINVLSGFVEGTAAPEEVGSAWDCFSHAITVFELRTRGRYEDRFTARELANFFERYFLSKNTKISDRLLLEIFRIKQLFVGGSATNITRVEMQKLVEFSRTMRSVSLKILPYMKVFSLNWKVSGFKTLEDDVKYFEEANEQLQQALRDLMTVFAANDQSYEVSNIIVLFSELASLNETQWEFIASMDKAMPIVYKLKQTLAGGDGRVILPNEWRRFGILSARGYIQYLRYYYFIQSAEIRGGGPELVYLARSLDDLFSYLGDMVAEKPGGLFTRGEFLEVLQSISQLWPDLKVSDTLVFEAMKIKQLFFGGSLDAWTPQDFERARSKVDAFRTLTERFLSYIEIYSLAWDPIHIPVEDQMLYFDGAEENLSEFAVGLGKLIETSYDLTDFTTLVTEVDTLYPREDGSRYSTLVTQYVPLVLSAKKIIFDDSETLIKRTQWRKLFEFASYGYSRIMQYYYFIKDKPLLADDTAGHMVTMLKAGLRHVEWLIDQRQGLVPFDSWNFLIDNLVTTGLLPKEITAASMKPVFEAAVCRIFENPEDRIAKKTCAGLKKDHIAHLQKEISNWYELQVFFKNTLQEPNSISQDVLIQKIEERIAVLASHNAPAEDIDLYKDFKAIVSTHSPQRFDDQERLIIARDNTTYSRTSLDILNLARVMSKSLIRGFANDVKRIADGTGTNNDEVNVLYELVKPLVAEFGWLKLDNTTFANSRFREANLFTARANGDDYMQHIEAIDLMTMIYSGLSIDGLIMKNTDTVPSCASIKFLLDEKKVTQECVRDLYVGHGKTSMESIPDQVKYVWALKESSFQKYIGNLLKAAGGLPDKSGHLLLSDVALAPHVAQYIESIMRRFDTNKDDYLNNKEAMKAYPVFRKILQTVAESKEEARIKGLFAWMLINSRPPETTMEKLRFYLWYKTTKEKSWKISATRQTMAAILGFISEATSKTPAIANLDEDIARESVVVPPEAADSNEDDQNIVEEIE